MEEHKKAASPGSDASLQARRQLLKLGFYAPPAILGAMLTHSGDALAANLGQTVNCGNGTIVISATGTACCPCVPGSNQYNPSKCKQEQCELGNCPACAQVAWGSRKKCLKEAPPQCQAYCP